MERGRKGAKSPTRRSPSRKSPARRKTKSPSRKSPARKSSPARKASPARKPSPARKQSPARKSSPGRKSNSSPKKSPSFRTSPVRSSPFSNSSIDERFRLSQIRNSPVLSRNSMPVEQKVFFDTLAVSRSTSLQPQLISSSNIITEESSITAGGDSSNAILTRRSVRIMQNSIKDLNIEDELSAKILKPNSIPHPDGHFNNTDKSYDKQVEPIQKEFGGVLGALVWMIVFPAITVILELSCTKNTCLPTVLDKLPLNWKYYFNKNIISVYFGFIAFQMFLSLIPVGSKSMRSSKYGSITFKNNTLFTTISTLAVLGGLYYYGYPTTIYIDKTLQFLSISIIFGLFLSIALFIKGRKTQNRTPYMGRNKLYDFFMGTEVNPRIGPFDIKDLLIKVALNFSIVYNALLIMKSVEGKAVSDYPFTLLLLSSLQVLYLLDFAFFEKEFQNSFELKQEAVGYMSAVGFLVWPFIFISIPKFIYHNRVNAPSYILAVAVVLYIIGYVIYRASNSQKAKFRMNPLNPNLAYLDTIQTTQGQKLICSGWWGWVRHPNYTGDLIMNWSWALVFGFSHWLPYFLPCSLTWFLLHRSARDNARCKARYGLAWDRYTHKVKYQVIPRVF